MGAAPAFVHARCGSRAAVAIARALAKYDGGFIDVRARPGGDVQVRSSITHPLQIAELTTPAGGSIGVTFCPGKCHVAGYQPSGAGR